ncbi:MAG: hypothetical protein ACOX7C_04775 [Brevefilum sp.]|jgi:hypothetical protein
MKKNKTLVILMFVLFPLLVGMACTCGLLPFGGKNVKETQEPTRIVEEIPTQVSPTRVAPVVPPVKTEEVKEDLDGDLVIERDNWGSDEDYVFVGFLLSNQNKDDMALTNVEYSIYMLDANEEIVAQDWSTYPLLLPGDKVAVFYQYPILEDDPTIESVEISYSHEGLKKNNGAVNPFSVEKIMYWDAGYWPIVTGIVYNDDPIVYTDVRATIVLTNSDGNVVGGGYTYIDFIPGYDEMGFSAYVDAYDTVETVEIYPVTSYGTKEYDDTNELWERVSIIDYTFYPDEYDLLYGGVVIQNNLDTVLEDALLAVTFYDPDGYVTSQAGEAIDYLMPGETLGIAPYIYSQPEGASASDFTIIIFPGEPAKNYELTKNVFTVNSAILTGSYDDMVKVNFTNTYNKEVSDVNVYALVYDSDGSILGGGLSYYIDPIPAGASADFEFYVTYQTDEIVDRIEAWVLPYYWTDFE